MSRTDVLTFVTDLGGGQEDGTEVERYYDDAIRELARLPIIANAALVSLSAGDTTYTLPSEAVNFVAAFYNDRQLGAETILSLNALDFHWRDLEGEPIAYTMEHESLHTFTLFPKPTASSQDFIFLFGDPFGRDYPSQSVAAIYTETRTDYPAWLDLPITFRIMEREYGKESDHRDDPFARICGEMADFLFSLVL